VRLVTTVLGMSGDEVGRDLAGLVVASAGGLVETGDRWEPYRLVDQVAEPVVPVSMFLRELQAAGRAAATQRSYALDLLRWFRFLQAVEVPWGQATRLEPVHTRAPRATTTCPTAGSKPTPDPKPGTSTISNHTSEALND
jgi:hypothetical protein